MQYREFWIKYLVDRNDNITETLCYEIPPQVNYNYHVIEYSAYEKLKAERHDILKEADRLAEALGWYAAENESHNQGMWDFRGVTKAREALESYRKFKGELK